MSTTLEREIEKKLTNMVKAHGGLCLKWVCPGWSGVPDRIILLPGARIVFAETKRPKGGKVSALQTWWRKTLRGLGFTVLHIYNQKDLDSAEALILFLI